MKLHERMKMIQTDSDIKVRALAPLLDTNEQCLGNYLNGKRAVPYDVLVKFAEFYHVTTDYLLGASDNPTPPFPISRSEQDMIREFRTLTKSQQELLCQMIGLMQKQNLKN